MMRGLIHMVLPAVFFALSFGNTVTARAEGVTIEYIAHSSFIIQSSAGTRLLIDPFADRVWLGYDFPKGLRYDAVAITHPHYDHDGGEFRKLPVPWPYGMPVFRDPGRYRVADLRLIGIKGKHADPYGKEFGQKNVIWIIESDHLRIAHVGDNRPLTHEQLAALGHIDILMMPAGGAEHILSNAESKAMIAAIAPRYVIPMHYRLPDLETPGNPESLGEIGPWLELWDAAQIRHVGKNRMTFSKGAETPIPMRSGTGAGKNTPRSEPVAPKIMVFDHAPYVTRPEKPAE